jgi:hypothetical protein
MSLNESDSVPVLGLLHSGERRRDWSLRRLFWHQKSGESVFRIAFSAGSEAQSNGESWSCEINTKFKFLLHTTVGI